MEGKRWTNQQRACIVLGVLHYIHNLKTMDDATYLATYNAWMEHKWEDPAWSEGFSHRIPGVTGPAFQSVCQKIACLSFHPGGVHIFGTWFMAKRELEWCAWHIWDRLEQQAWSIIRELYEQAQIEMAKPAVISKKKKGSKKQEATSND